MSRFFDAPKWTDEELKTARLKSEESFKDRRRREGPERYREAFLTAEPEVRNALLKTKDLTDISDTSIMSEGELWRVLRYFCGPHISEEDFWTLVGKKFRRVTADIAADAAEVVRTLLDPHRMPWVASSRAPTESERNAAILATATLLAHEQLRTSRRGVAARTQEDEVAEALVSVGFIQIPAADRRPIALIDDLPKGSFSREQKVAGSKCDVPVRLRDGRLLTIECKVSNGPKNSWKRLVREVGGKGNVWKAQFGALHLTGAVLAGVFDLSCLIQARDAHGIVIFWQHDLSTLKDFVSAAK